jgi:hypothetical protein
MGLTGGRFSLHLREQKIIRVESIPRLTIHAWNLGGRSIGEQRASWDRLPLHKEVGDYPTSRFHPLTHDSLVHAFVRHLLKGFNFIRTQVSF